MYGLDVVDIVEHDDSFWLYIYAYVGNMDIVDIVENVDSGNIDNVDIVEMWTVWKYGHVILLTCGDC